MASGEILLPHRPVLLVDDDENIVFITSRLLRANGINNIVTSTDSRNVLDMIEKHDPEIVLLDLEMPHITGNDLLSVLVENDPDLKIIISTGVEDVTMAVDCMRAGAFDYIVKGLDIQRIASVVLRAIEMNQLKAENRKLAHTVLTTELERPEAFEEIITDSNNMRTIFDYIEAIADSRKPVLVSGESGVGKESMARAIHKRSNRCDGPFIAVNVAGLDDEMFSDTLFGHTKGAFTSAVSSREGLIEKARGGTLLLDEIGDMKLASQVKLLRVIQENEYYPLGADAPKYCDVRIIVSTNRDLRQMQQEGSFRNDLFYRLNTHHIQIPSLRERLSDLPLLVDHFVREAAESVNRKVPLVTREILTLLGTYDFPGNIRELQSLLYDAVISSKGQKLLPAQFEHLVNGSEQENIHSFVDDSDGFTENIDRLPTLKEGSELLVKEAMKKANGNQSVAAGFLGISQQALSKRLKKMEQGSASTA